MDKLKNVLSHGSKKGAQGEGSHLDDAHHNQGHSTSGTGATEYHPIYDQFAKQGTSVPAATTGDSTHFTEPANMTSSSSPKDMVTSSTRPGEHHSSSSVRPDATLHRPGNPTDEASTASIKSGIMGFPQGRSQPSASESQDLGRDHSTTAAQSASILPDRSVIGQHELSSHHTGGEISAAEEAPAHGLHRQRDYDDLKAHQSSTGSGQPFERSFDEPSIAKDTDRAFPLTGGVTSTKQSEPHSTATQPGPHSSSTGEMRPETNDKNAGILGRAREALAGATAAFGMGGTGSSGSHSNQERHHEEPLTGAEGGPTTSADVLRAEHELRSGHQHDQAHQKYGGEALAGATAAYMGSSSSHRPDHVDCAEGEEPKYTGDPCAADEKQPSSTVFTDGPHKTDTANRIDPHLHVPGEFVTTPLETPGERGRGTEDYVSGTGRRPEGTSTDLSTAGGNQYSGSTATHSMPSSTDIDSRNSPRSGDFHDALGAGAIGAAALGASGAAKHHQREPTDIEGQEVQTRSNPYSSTQIDPRVHSNSATSGYASGPTSQSQPVPTSHHERTQPHLTEQTDTRQKDHQYGRDAGLVGAGAATAGGLYYATQQDHKSDPVSGSTTSGSQGGNASNLDPKVQPDPRFQPNPALQEHTQTRSTSDDPATAMFGTHRNNVTHGDEHHVYGTSEQQQKDHTTTAPHQSNLLNKLDPRVDSKAQSGEQHHTARDGAAGAGVAGYGAHQVAKDHDQHRSTQPGATLENHRYDPSAPGAHDPNQTGQHHYGRDAALATGAGGLAYAATRDHDQSNHPTAPNQHQISQVSGQPRAQGYPSQSDTRSPESQHHHSRDAAIGAAGLGAAGTGMYGASKRGENESQQPHTIQEGQHHGLQQHGVHHHGNKQDEEPVTYESLKQQQYGSSEELGHHQRSQEQQYHGRDTALAAGGVAGLGAGAGYGYAQHESKDAERERLAQQPQYGQDQQHHGRDTALAGGGVAGLGAGAGYGYTQQHDNKDAQHERPIQHQQYGQEQQHHGRDAALAAGGVAGLGAGAGYAYAQHDDEKERLAQQQAQEKEMEHQHIQHPKELEKQQRAEQKAHEKELEHQRKEEEKQLAHKKKEEQKALEAQQKAAEKERIHEQKHHDKLVAAEQKEHEKEVMRQEQAQQKEMEKENARLQKEAAQREHEEENKDKKHHLFGFLHKDKKDSPERSPRTSRDYAIEETGSPARRTSIGHDGRHKLHKDPPPGHPAWQVLGKQSDGTSDDAHHPVQHPGDDKLHSGVYEAPSTQEHFVTEPHTGLPMNVGKYGDGRGGTDASETVDGYQRTTGIP